MALPDGSDNHPPEWIHLTPAGTFGGKDGRGPFILKNAADVIERSMHMARGKIVVDINHSTHVAAARGERSDAVGWITELNARTDGIWGRVEWNGTGRQLMADHAYRGISPAIGSASDGTVEWIEAVSLTNRPNLGVADLHSQNQETRMDLAQLRRTLGLSETATEDDINAAIARGKAAVTLHASVAKIVGLDANASDAAVLAAVQARGADVSTHAQTEIDSLQGQLTAQKKAFDALQGQLAKTSAENWIKDLSLRKEISEKTKERLITLHMQDVAAAADLADGLKDLPDDSLARLSLHSQGAARSGDKPDKLVSAMESALIPSDKAGG